MPPSAPGETSATFGHGLRVRAAATIGRLRVAVAPPPRPDRETPLPAAAPTSHGERSIGREAPACRGVQRAVLVYGIARPLLVWLRRGGAASAVRVTPGAAAAAAAVELTIDLAFDLAAYRGGRLDGRELLARSGRSALEAGGSAAVVILVGWIALPLAPAAAFVLVTVAGAAATAVLRATC